MLPSLTVVCVSDSSASLPVEHSLSLTFLQPRLSGASFRVC